MPASDPKSQRSSEGAVRDGEVDSAAKAAFEGLLVSKARARRFASGHSIPYHLAESLIAGCRAEGASGREAAQKARALLSSRLAEPEDIELIKMRASREGPVRIIDRVEGKFDARQDEPVLTFSQLGLTKVPVRVEIAEKHTRLLKSGFYADIELAYEDATGSGSAFRVKDLRPLDSSSLDLRADLKAGRKHFSDVAWPCFLVRSVGYAAPSAAITPRTTALILHRLVPLVQKQYSMLELGPRQSGKTFPYEELAPQAFVLSTGKATPSKLYIHAGTGEAGLVATEDVVCLDEVTTASGLDEILSGLKSYLSSGTVSRGKHEVHGQASIVLLGNVDRPVEEILEGGGQLFAPLPEAFREDTALMDRISAQLPGWEMPKLGTEHYASGLALPSDVLAECLKELREVDYKRSLKRDISLEGNLKKRDREAAWKTIGGLLKLIYPDPETRPSKEVLRWAAWLGLEMRLRVRAQQRRLQPEEFDEGEFGFQVGGEDRVVRVRLPEDQ